MALTLVGKAHFDKRLILASEVTKNNSQCRFSKLSRFLSLLSGSIKVDEDSTVVAGRESDNLLAIDGDVGIRDTIITVANLGGRVITTLVSQDNRVVIMVGIGDGHLASPCGMNPALGGTDIRSVGRGMVQSTTNTGGEVLGQEWSKNIGSCRWLRNAGNLRSSSCYEKSNGLVVHVEELSVYWM